MLLSRRISLIAVVLMLAGCETTREQVTSPSAVEETASVESVTLTQGEWVGYAAGDGVGASYLGYFCDIVDRSDMTVTVEGDRITGTITSALDGEVIPVSWTFDGTQVIGRLKPKITADPRVVRGRLVDGALSGRITSTGSSSCSGVFLLRPSVP